MSEGSSASARVEAAAEALRKSISYGGLTTLLPNPVLGGLLAALPDTPSGESRGETVAAYREALQEIATRPTVERNPDGDDQATETMQLLARETLAAHGELRPAMPNMPEAESRVRKPAHNEQQGEEEARADDEALNSSGPSCEARSETQADNSTYYCTRPAGHSGQHVAADAHKVVARWPAPDAPEVADPAHAPDCAIAEAGGRHGCTCEVAERPPEDTEEAPSRALGFNPWCCIECGPVPADEIDAIGGEHDYRHVIGHPEHEEPEAFRIDLSEWHLRAPAQPDTKGEGRAEPNPLCLRCAANPNHKGPCDRNLASPVADRLRASAHPTQPVSTEEDKAPRPDSAEGGGDERDVARADRIIEETAHRPLTLDEADVIGRILHRLESLTAERDQWEVRATETGVDLAKTRAERDSLASRLLAATAQAEEQAEALRRADELAGYCAAEDGSRWALDHPGQHEARKRYSAARAASSPKEASDGGD